MRITFAPGLRSVGGLSLWVASLLGAFGGSNALAQCVIEYDADLSPPVAFGGGSGAAIVKGTFNCGEVVKGTLCGLGTYLGDCISNTNSAEVVSCYDDCTVDTAAQSVNCNGAEVFRGEASGTCFSSVCQSDSHGIDGTTSHSIVVADAATVESGVQNCGVNGAGVSHGHYVGVTTIPLPIP